MTDESKAVAMKWFVCVSWQYLIINTGKSRKCLMCCSNLTVHPNPPPSPTSDQIVEKTSSSSKKMEEMEQWKCGGST